MDSRAVQSQAHEYHEHQHHHPHNVGLQQVAHGTEEHHHDHEKKSVLKKVKAKAKKIKDTITKHGHHEHGHDNEYHYGDQHIPDDHDLDEEDDEDEEMVEDPEVHGAPIYDSAAVRSATPGQTEHLGKPIVNFGGAQVMGVEPHHEPRVVVVSPSTEINQSRSTDPARTFVGEDKGVHRKVNLERPMGLEKDPHAPGSRPEAHAHGNYQTKVTDPTGAGGEEIDIAPVQKSFDRMTIHNEPKPNRNQQVLPTITETHHPPVSRHQFVPELSTATKTHFPPAESHDQHLPPLSSEIKTRYPRSHDHFTPEMSTVPKTPYPPYPYAEGHNQNLSEPFDATKTQYPSVGTHDQFVPELSTEPKSHYTSSIIHDQNFPEQYSATKSQYPSAGTGSHDHFVPQLSTQTKTQYPSAGTGSHDHFVPQLSTQTKTHYPSAGSHDQFAPEQVPTSTNMYPENPIPTAQTFNTTNTVQEQPQPNYESMEKPANESSYTDKISSATSAITDKAISAKNAVASKLGYGEKGEREESQTRYNEENISGEKPSNQSSYTEKISSATSAIADKAVSAKNTVASKLGYGEKGEIDDKVTTHEENKSKNASNMSESATEYGQKIALSLTEKLAPVYGKVAGVGSAVKSKVPGTGASTNAGAGAGIERESLAKEQDKGVSVKDYLVDKLRPGDEDRALSEVISETLHKRGQEATEVDEEENRDVKKVVSDAIHKRDEEPERAVPLGKVTESEEVRRRLGGGDEKTETETRYEESNVKSPGKGVVGKLKGVVGSWFGKSEENQSSQGAGAENFSRQHVAVEEQVPRAAG